MLARLFLSLIIMLLLAAKPASAQPVIFWFNDPVGPDETILVTGAELDAVTAVTVSREPDAGTASPPPVETAVEILQANPQSLKVVVPAQLAPGIYLMTLRYAEGSITISVNRPTVYWTQGQLGQSTVPGGWLQVFGRNIVRHPGRARLLLVPEAGGAAVTAVLAEGGMWRARFQIPGPTTPGTYRLRLFNGDGSNSGWSDAGQVIIQAIGPDTPPQEFDVRAFGAIGDGRKDNTSAFRKAIEAARDNGGGTVYIPRGRYLITEGLVLPPTITLRGERTDLVNLVWPDFENPPDSLIKGASSFAIEDLTIYASNHLHVVSGGFVQGDFAAPNASDIAIRRVRIRADAFRGLMTPEQTYKRMADWHRIFPGSSAPVSIRLSGKQLEVTDCDVVGSGSSLLLFKASDASVVGNTLGNGRNGNYSIMGSRRVIFENNRITAIDLQATGGAISTVSNWIASSENVFFSGNVIVGIYGWDREALTTDGPAGFYFGHAQTSSKDRLTLLDEWKGTPVSPEWAGALLMVVGGRGAGQHARILAPQKTTVTPQSEITLDRPLAAALDSTSLVTIVQAQQNYLIIGNTFEDTGVAAQSFGTAIGHVIADNRATRSSGFFAIGLSYGHLQPSWQVQLLGNRIIEGNVYRAGPAREAFSEEAAIGVHAYQTESRPGWPPLARAIIIRGNKLEEDAHIELKGFSSASPGIRDVVVEANAIGPSRVGLQVDGGVATSLSRRNDIRPRIGR